MKGEGGAAALPEKLKSGGETSILRLPEKVKVACIGELFLKTIIEVAGINCVEGEICL